MRPSIVAALCMGVFIGTASAADYMSADEIKALISGKTTHGVGLKKDFTVVTHFAPDGSLMGERNGNKRTGSWNVTDDGQHCVDFSDGKNNCRFIKDNGDGTYSRVKVKTKGNGTTVHIPVVKWERIEEGNALK